MGGRAGGADLKAVEKHQHRERRRQGAVVAAAAGREGGVESQRVGECGLEGRGQVKRVLEGPSLTGSRLAEVNGGLIGGRRGQGLGLACGGGRHVAEREESQGQRPGPHHSRFRCIQLTART